jgi:hypothetical protein
VGKKQRVQVKQVRRQMRQMKVKPGQQQPSPADQRRQRERYVESGGFVQGYAPEAVLRLGYGVTGLLVVCLLIAIEVAIGPLRPIDQPTAIVAAIVWAVPIVMALALLGPGVRLAWLDRKAQPKVVQGQLVGASSVSPSRGLGMIMVRTRQGTEQYLVQPQKLARVPGNVVQVVLSVTPRINHVRSVQVIGQRQVPRAESPMPEVLRRIQLLPILTPVSIAVAAIVGAEVVGFIPFTPSWAHALATLVAAVALGGGAFGITYLYQRRLMEEAQKLVPGGLS